MGEIITVTTERKMVPLEEVGTLKVTCSQAAAYFDVNVSRIYKLIDRGHIRKINGGIPIEDLYTCNQEIARGSCHIPFVNQ